MPVSPLRRTMHPLYRQHGVVLIVALVFLLLLTILAISVSGRSLLQERMAGGLHNAQLAEISAETALRGAEWSLWSNASQVGAHLDCPANSISSEGCITYNLGTAPYAVTGSVTQFRTSPGWLSPAIGLSYQGASGSFNYTASTLGAGNTLAQNPTYLIEDLGVELPPGAGPQHESGDTGPNNTGPGQVNMHIYRITARATGGNQNSVRVLQSTFDAQTNN